MHACMHAQVSYMILQRVSPVTHSIGNCLKRVIVIVASVIFFRNPMGTQNIIGALHKAILTTSASAPSLAIVPPSWHVAAGHSGQCACLSCESATNRRHNAALCTQGRALPWRACLHTHR